MSAENKITVELTEADARGLASGSWLHDSPGGRLQAAIRDALPPEYVRGALYRVDGLVGFFDGLAFVLADDTRGNSIAAYSRREPHQVTKVEPIRALADDQIAVTLPKNEFGRLGFDANDIRLWARRAREDTMRHTANALDAYADALKAEAKS